jgi:hypothetical protein
LSDQFYLPTGDVIVPEGPRRFGPDGHAGPEALVRWVNEARLSLVWIVKTLRSCAGRARLPIPTRTGEIASSGDKCDTTYRAEQV